MATPAEQITDSRNWQTLASYVRLQGGQVGTSPRLIPDEVTRYFRGILMDDDLQPADILQDHLANAQRAVEAQSAVSNWRNQLKAFQVRIDSLPELKTLAPGDRLKFSTVILEMIGRLSVTIGGKTENMGGVISVAKTVIVNGTATAMFALFHEFGHGVQTEGDIPGSVKDALFTSSVKGAKFGELFADAFAAIALRALGKARDEILTGAKGALEDHGDDGDHPDWPTRELSIKDVLG